MTTTNTTPRRRAPGGGRKPLDGIGPRVKTNFTLRPEHAAALKRMTEKERAEFLDNALKSLCDEQQR